MNTENIPLPQGWKWKKLGDIFKILAGGDVQTKYYSKIPTKEHKYPIFANSLKEKGLYGYSSVYTIENEAITITARGNIGHATYRTGLFTPIIRLIVCIPRGKMNLSYFTNAINTVNFMKVGSAVKQLTIPDVSNYLVPVPPLEEQGHIERKLDIIFQEIINVQKECKIALHNNSTFKQKIISKALKGELTTRFKTDDSVEELYTQIQKEKQELSKQKKIKKLKPLPPITDPPYTIPTTWKWVRLGDICELVRGPFGGSLKKEIFVKKGYKVYEQQHAIKNDCSINNYFITEQKYMEMERFQVNTDDILMSCSGTIGKMMIIPRNYDAGIINQALLKITVNNKILNNTFFIKILENLLNKYTQGSGMKNITSVKELEKILIEVPPISEQERIMERLEFALNACNQIETEIKLKQTDLQTLKTSILNKAFKGKL